MIGLFNVPGTYSAGAFGAKINKTRILAGIDTHTLMSTSVKRLEADLM